jgi:hypothetical protein
MSKDTASDQAQLIGEMRRAAARKAETMERNVTLQIAGMATAVFVALFCVLYVMNAEPPLPEFEVTLACKEIPRTRTVIIAAPAAKEAIALVRKDFPGCEIAPRRAVAGKADTAGAEDAAVE